MSKKLISFAAIMITMTSLAGCASFEPLGRSMPAPGPETSMDLELKSLPPPKEQVIAAVYSFRDETGQYKAISTGTSFSTAVTQGGASILVKALAESGWFVPVEREGLSDLLTERKIIRSTRDQYLGQDGKKLPNLPPLLYAGILLEGGIISYDSNILTGGEGAAYFGLSASGQYHEDRVTVYLRAVSTQNGRVLATVNASKTVLSQEIDVGFYRYISYSQLAQAEAGFTYNEPVDVAVTEAIQEAVKDLIIVGVRDGLWQLEFPGDTTSPVFTNYYKSLKKIASHDDLGRPFYERRGVVRISLGGGARIYNGDYANSESHAEGDLSLGLRLSPSFYATLSGSIVNLSAAGAFNNTFANLDLKGVYNLMPSYSVTPYVTFGAGVLMREASKHVSLGYPLSLPQKAFGTVTWGLGVEYLLDDNVGFSFELDNHYALSDEVDGMINGKYFDYMWSGRFGINVYLGY